MKSLIIPGAVTLVVIAAGAYYQGTITERWSPQKSELLEQFTNSLASLPSVIGEWEGVDETIPDEEFKLTNCTGYVSRQYTNKSTGDTVSIYLVAGTARHITIHSPDWCYQGAGFKMEGAKRPYTVSCGSQMPTDPTFSTATFAKNTPEGFQRLRILWSYSDDGKWDGPNNHKFHYAGRAALYKIYLISQEVGDDLSVESSLATKFATVIMPVLNESLFQSNPSIEKS